MACLGLTSFKGPEPRLHGRYEHAVKSPASLLGPSCPLGDYAAEDHRELSPKAGVTAATNRASTENLHRRALVVP